MWYRREKSGECARARTESWRTRKTWAGGGAVAGVGDAAAQFCALQRTASEGDGGGKARRGSWWEPREHRPSSCRRSARVHHPRQLSRNDGREARCELRHGAEERGGGTEIKRSLFIFCSVSVLSPHALSSVL